MFMLAALYSDPGTWKLGKVSYTMSRPIELMRL
jgi:hypothetical protein